MATQKPISTISYNSESFLCERLDVWLKSHIIQAYQYIKHKGEDGDKDHIHLRIEPNKKLDPMDLTEKLKEFIKNSDKPLCVRPWRPSQEEDWYLYVVHDPEYLKRKYDGGDKGEKIPYNYQDIVVSDGYDLEVAFVRAKAKMNHTAANLITRMQGGENAKTLIAAGENVFTVNALMRALNQTDYEKMQDKIVRLKDTNMVLLSAIRKAGLYVHMKDGGEVYLCDSIEVKDDMERFDDFIADMEV